MVDDGPTYPTSAGKRLREWVEERFFRSSSSEPILLDGASRQVGTRRRRLYWRAWKTLRRRRWCCDSWQYTVGCGGFQREDGPTEVKTDITAGSSQRDSSGSVFGIALCAVAWPTAWDCFVDAKGMMSWDEVRRAGTGTGAGGLAFGSLLPRRTWPHTGRGILSMASQETCASWTKPW